MSGKERYPGWGTYGTASENTTSEPRLEITPSAGDSTWVLTQSVAIDMATGVITHNLKIDDDDSKEQIDDARANINREIRRAVLKSPAGERYRLSGGRDAMSAVIERARSEATDHEDVHSVWAALVAMALREDRDAPLLGLTDDGSSIKYRGNGNVTTIFTFKMLKGRLGRQEKARKGS